MWDNSLQQPRIRKEEEGNMCAHLMIKAWCPPDKINEVGQIILKTWGELPRYMKAVGQSPYITATRQGIKSYSIFEIPDEKLGEAIREYSVYVTKYFSVAGYRHTVEVIVGIKDALQAIGLKPKELQMFGWDITA
jgi:hypothetical protein